MLKPLAPQLEYPALPLDESRIFKPINIALLTVSDTRTFADDTSGDILADRIVEAGHKLVDRAIERDDASRLVARLHGWIDNDDVDCVISTGGTGLTGRDITPEALDRVKTKDIPGFGELFRWLSYDSIGTSTLQSRVRCACTGRLYLRPARFERRGEGWLGQNIGPPARPQTQALQFR